MAPVNDNFANASDLGTALSGSYTVDLTDATTEPGEPDPFAMSPLHSQHTVWWKWTPAFTGAATFTCTLTTHLDNVYIAAYTGSGLGNLTEVSLNWYFDFIGSYTANIRFQCHAGTTYYIQLGRDPAQTWPSGGPIATMTWRVGPHRLPTAAGAGRAVSNRNTFPDTLMLRDNDDYEGISLLGNTGLHGMYPPPDLLPFNDSQIIGGQFFRGHQFFITHNEISDLNQFWFHEYTRDFESLIAVHTFEMSAPYFSSDVDRPLCVEGEKAVVVLNVNTGAGHPIVQISALDINLGSVTDHWEIYGAGNWRFWGSVAGGNGSCSKYGDRLLFPISDWGPNFSASQPTNYVVKFDLVSGTATDWLSEADWVALINQDVPSGYTQVQLAEFTYVIAMPDGGAVIADDNNEVIYRLDANLNVMWGPISGAGGGTFGTGVSSDGQLLIVGASTDNITSILDQTQFNYAADVFDINTGQWLAILPFGDLNGGGYWWASPASAPPRWSINRIRF